VNTSNLYGETKPVLDKLFISANTYSGGKGARFVAVRYGNVAGSRDFVIPFFKELIEQRTELQI
jgi:UDP-N-acetylglucosamine 4,6-dehydratase